MGIWDNVFGSKEEKSDKERQVVNWTELTSSQELDTLTEDSYDKPQLIFKHSMTCGVSGMTKRRFEAEAGQYADQFGFHLLVIQKNRDISNQVAVKFQVRHESPQVLIIREGVVTEHASHWQIDSISLG